MYKGINIHLPCENINLKICSSRYSWIILVGLIRNVNNIPTKDWNKLKSHINKSLSVLKTSFEGKNKYFDSYQSKNDFVKYKSIMGVASEYYIPYHEFLVKFLINFKVL